MENTVLTPWNWLECLYYVIVTITTVGFGDYVPGKGQEPIDQEASQKSITRLLYQDSSYEALTLLWAIPAIILFEIIKERIVNAWFSKILYPTTNRVTIFQKKFKKSLFLHDARAKIQRHELSTQHLKSRDKKSSRCWNCMRRQVSEPPGAASLSDDEFYLESKSTRLDDNKFGRIG